MGFVSFISGPVSSARSKCLNVGMVAHYLLVSYQLNKGRMLNLQDHTDVPP